MGFSLVSHYRRKEKEIQASCLESNSTICSKPNGEGGLWEQQSRPEIPSAPSLMGRGTAGAVSPGLRSMTQNLAYRSQTTAWQRDVSVGFMTSP